MKKLTLAVLTLLGTPAISFAGSFVTYEGQLIRPGEYVVVFKSDAGKARAAEDAILALSRSGSIKIDQRWQSALHGMAISNVDEATAKEIAATEGVESVAQNKIIHPSATQLSAPQQLDRIDQYDLPTDGKFTYGFYGNGVNAYIIDSAIRTTHNDFRPVGNPTGPSRASMEVDIAGSGFTPRRHGTQVASVVGGITSGVAKNVRIRGVNITSSTENTNTAWLIGGINWVRQNGVRPAVVNISYNPASDSSVKTAVESLVAAGFFVSASAGNSPGDACIDGVAGANGVYTVAGMDDTDKSFADPIDLSRGTATGPCVSAYARYGVVSAAYNSDSLFMSDGGTSYSAPIAAGIAAQLLQSFPNISPAAVKAELNGRAALNRVTGIPAVPAGTPNRILIAF